MIISPVPSAVTPVADPNGTLQPSRVENIRSLRMKTNYNPQDQDMYQVPEENKVPDEVTQPLSPQLALLAKQRRALQVEKRELERIKSEYESKSSATPGIDTARFKSDPLGVMLENGITYDQLTEAIMRGQGNGNSEIHALKSEIESLRSGIDQKFTEKDAQNEQQVLAEMRREADQTVQGNDEFELVREMKRVPDVIKLIERTYRETGEVLPVTEALRLFEDELFKDAQRITGFKKLQSQMPQYQPQQRPMGMRTLTNRDTAQTPLTPKQRAFLAFGGNLKR